MMWRNGYGMASGWVMLLALALLVMGVVYLVRTQEPGQGQLSAKKPPADRLHSILRERFAKGAIDQVEFETQQQVSRGGESNDKNEVSRE